MAQLLSGVILQFFSVLSTVLGSFASKELYKVNNIYAVLRQVHLYGFIASLIIIMVCYKRIAANINFRHLYRSFVISIFLIVNIIFIYKALSVAHPVYTSLFARSYIPLNIVIASILFKEKLLVKEALMIVLIFTGMTLFSLKSEPFNFSLKAVFYISIHCCAVSCAFVMTQKWKSEEDYFSINMISKLFANLMIFAFLYCTHKESFSFESDAYSPLAINILLIMASVMIIISHLLFFKSTNMISFQLGSVIRSISPLMAYVLSCFICPVKLSLVNSLGGILAIIAMSSLILIGHSKKAKK